MATKKSGKKKTYITFDSEKGLKISPPIKDLEKQEVRFKATIGWQIPTGRKKPGKAKK